MAADGSADSTDYEGIARGSDVAAGRGGQRYGRLMRQTLRETLERPQQVFEKATNTIATNEPERQESLEDEGGAASSAEKAPSTNGERKPAETAAEPSTIGERKPTEAAGWHL
jgi:hypothetical protein